MDATSRRTTVYFDADLHRALRLRAAESDRSISEIVNDAVRELLVDDAEDLEAFEQRVDEKTLSFEAFVKDLRLSGKL